MVLRDYDPNRDKKATHRIWQEVGWIGDDSAMKAAVDAFLAAGRALVAEVNGEAESLVNSMPGVIRYIAEDLPFSAVTSVATSRVARKQGFAKRLTAQLAADDAAAGVLVSGLCFFEQGYYDALGYGSGGYEHWISFDPAQLKVNVRARVPRRLTTDDWKAMHKALLARRRGHGGINILPDAFTRDETMWAGGGFGLGYYDGPGGELTHFIWCQGGGENGPYTIILRAYRDWDQFMELMALVKSLGDQVRRITMREPGVIQMQDLLAQPFRYRQLTEKSRFESKNSAVAYWQLRICDLPGCLEKTHLRGDTVRFNLALSDPIGAHLPADAPWRGVGGDYVVTLGPESGAEPGTDAALPTLKASVGAFTRMWIGARPASSLAVTDDLGGPPDLIEALDWALCLPAPRPDWDF
ncbi:MAG: GNAT family N-acetyltransferase [Anaerolineae bacterium]|nr:GNAT family N-acetyltransferase [Anaerolineae bacterium]